MRDYQLEEKYNELGKAHVKAMEENTQLKEENEYLVKKIKDYQSSFVDFGKIINMQLDDKKRLKELLVEASSTIRQLDNKYPDYGLTDKIAKLLKEV